jgi:hypothetical protein
MRVRSVAAVVAVVVVVAAVATGLVMLGPPSEQRALALDERRAASLQAMRFAIDAYWHGQMRLPRSIGELLQGNMVLVADTKDPVSGREYRYRVVTGMAYELCADFERPGPSERAGIPFSTHGSGTRCFDLHVPDAVGQP